MYITVHTLLLGIDNKLGDQALNIFTSTVRVDIGTAVKKEYT